MANDTIYFFICKCFWFYQKQLAVHSSCILSINTFPGNQTFDADTASTKLYQWSSTGYQCLVNLTPIVSLSKPFQFNTHILTAKTDENDGEYHSVAAITQVLIQQQCSHKTPWAYESRLGKAGCQLMHKEADRTR